MKAFGGCIRAGFISLLVAAGPLTATIWVEAHRTPRPGATPTPSTTPGRYCGGDPLDGRGIGLNLDKECKTAYGPKASAVAIRQDAYGWVCRIPGKPDARLQMRDAGGRAHGSNAIATLVGIGVNDWRCLRPGDVNGRIVPVLLFPRDKLKPSEVPFVSDALRRVEKLMAGVRRFYSDRASKPIKGTNAFVLLTETSATDWQKLAEATDHAVPPFLKDRFGFHNRVKHELAVGGWGVLAQNAKVRIGGFVTLGSSPSEAPSWLGAAGDKPDPKKAWDSGSSYFSQAPESSYASCDPKKKNSTVYERAFYAAAHELGHTFGLADTQDLQFGGKVPRPPDWEHSIMQVGKGTESKLFSFEATELEKFLKNWP